MSFGAGIGAGIAIGVGSGMAAGRKKTLESLEKYMKGEGIKLVDKQGNELEFEQVVIGAKDRAVDATRKVTTCTT